MREDRLTARIKELIEDREFEKGRQLTAEAMREAPDAAEPHNLLGIILEEMGDHTGAMKHFRAANALDPTCLPARCNMDNYGSFNKDTKKCAYTVDDCPEPFIKSRKAGEYNVHYK